MVAQNERNFHIFYQLIKGLRDDSARQALFLEEDVGAYNYLNQSVCRELEGVDDAEEFAAVETAFTAMEFPKKTVQEIWKIVAAVLTLGNISTGPSSPAPLPLGLYLSCDYTNRFCCVVQSSRRKTPATRTVTPL